MKIVIDIPEEDYKRVGLIVEMGLGTNIDESIKGGIVLPKGHGRLIDADELLKEPMDTANYPSNYVKIAPTIIEADMENE